MHRGVVVGGVGDRGVAVAASPTCVLEARPGSTSRHSAPASSAPAWASSANPCQAKSSLAPESDR